MSPLAAGRLRVRFAGFGVVLMLAGVTRAANAEHGVDDQRADDHSAQAHSMAVYARTGGTLITSRARTVAGLGGGFGLRDTMDDWAVLQADASYLFGAGSVGELRFGGGLTIPGWWGVYRPALLGLLSLYFGEQQRFLSEDHPTRVGDPAVVLGTQLEALRFVNDSVSVSLLAVGIGAALDLPSVGVAYQATVLETGFAF